jgi:hypothetical protein
LLCRDGLGWIVSLQFLSSIPLAIPTGYLLSPAVPISELPLNTWQGLLCFFGHNSHPDDQCNPQVRSRGP